MSEQEENYHRGNDLPDTSTLTSAATPWRGRPGGGVWRGGVRTEEDTPVSQTAGCNTAGAKNTDRQTRTKKIVDIGICRIHKILSYATPLRTHTQTHSLGTSGGTLRLRNVGLISVCCLSLLA